MEGMSCRNKMKNNKSVCIYMLINYFNFEAIVVNTAINEELAMV